jgi:hypothetical protein
VSLFERATERTAEDRFVHAPHVAR